MPQTYTPFSFQAYCVPRARNATRASLDAFTATVGAAPDATWQSESWIIHVRTLGDSRQGSDPDGRVSALLHGEVHDEFGDSPQSIARRYRVRGKRLVEDLNGSFALLVLDRDTDRVFVATDRMGSRRVFCSADEGGVWLTSELRHQPVGGRPLDPVGVAWLLTSSSCKSGRTPYQGVSVLAHGSLHEVHEGGVVSRRYWSHLLRSSSADGQDYERLTEALAERLVAAVKRRVEGEDELFMSLSGGYDSTAIAMIMKDVLDVSHVRSFSYTSRPAYGKARDFEDCDPTLKDSYVAQRTARTLGFSHRVVETYGGDLMAHLRFNARMTQGMGSGWSGADVWTQLRGEFEASSNPVLLAGDQYLGLSEPSDAQTVEEVVSRARVTRLVLPVGAREAFPADLLGEMRDGLDADLEDAIARQEAGDDLSLLHEHLVHDLHNVQTIFPWRENFAGRFARVRNPLLDSDVLDFMIEAPRSARNEKKLMLDAVRLVSPTFHEFERAHREAYHPSFRELIAQEADRLRAWILSSDSRLDDLIPRAFGLELLESVLDPTRVRGSVTWQSEAVRRRLAGRVPGVRAPDRAIGPTPLFKRWATIRMSLE